MGINDTAEQLDACKAQSVADERTIAALEEALRTATRSLAECDATIEGLARQNTELEHDLARAEGALADRLQHDAHARQTLHTIDRDAIIAILTGLASETADVEGRADEIVALVQSFDGILISPDEAALAARAARHSAESIRAVLDVDPGRLHPDVAGYVQRLQDLADRLTREGA